MRFYLQKIGIFFLTLHPLMVNSDIPNNQKKEIVRQQNIYDFKVKHIDGEEYTLDKYHNQVMVIVNVASKCGFAKKSYTALAELLKAYKSQGLVTLLFPCYQFGNQEFKDPEDIKRYAATYGGDFTLMSPIDVNGSNAHPLFTFLKKKKGGWIYDDIKWNFTFFLVDRNGEPVKRYGPNTVIELNDKDLNKCLDTPPSFEKTKNSAQ